MDDDTLAPEPEPTPADAPALTRLRIQFAAPTAAATPIHALRVGTFTDSLGRETTFTPADLQQMADRLNAGAQRRRPPINEGHDYGRAVGRMTEAYTRHQAHHLYIVPRWNGEGQRLLADEVYDAFSIELDTANGYTVIGGALTNYPAVDGLRPVALSSAEAGAATIALPAGDVPADEPPVAEEPPMSDEPTAQPVTPSAAAPVAPPAPATLDLTDPVVRQQVEAYQTEMRAAYQRQHELAMQSAREQARAEFERWRADETRRQGHLSFAQSVTTPTVTRPTTVAWSVEQIMDALTAPTAETVQRLFQDALDGALLVSGQAVGSAAGGAEPDAGGQWEALVLTYRQQGLSQSDAVRAAGRKRPDLYASQSRPKGGR